MLTLLLFRHAKAERSAGSLSDRERPLALRGREAADAMGRRLAVEGLMPDSVLCSPATRTLETLALASPYWTPAPQVSIVPELYEAMGEDYLDILRAAPPARRLMLVGHNSATEDTARALTGSGEQGALSALAAGFPTAGLAIIDFAIDAWSEVREGEGLLTAFLLPR